MTTAVPCRRCAEPGRVVDVVQGGNVVASGALCDACLAAARAALDELRRQFEALLSAGLSRDQANAIMIARIEGRSAAA